MHVGVEGARAAGVGIVVGTDRIVAGADQDGVAQDTELRAYTGRLGPRCGHGTWSAVGHATGSVHGAMQAPCKADADMQVGAATQCIGRRGRPNASPIRASGR
jgi:hypothetical protein